MASRGVGPCVALVDGAMRYLAPCVPPCFAVLARRFVHRKGLAYVGAARMTPARIAPAVWSLCRSVADWVFAGYLVALGWALFRAVPLWVTCAGLLALAVALVGVAAWEGWRPARPARPFPDFAPTDWEGV